MYIINEGNTGNGLSRNVIDAFLRGFEGVSNTLYWSEPYYKTNSFELECDDLFAYDVAFLGKTTGSDYIDEQIISAAEDEEAYWVNLYKDEGGNYSMDSIDDALHEELGKVKYTITLQPSDDNKEVFVYLQVYFGDNTWDDLYQNDFYMGDIDEVETAGMDIANKLNKIVENNQ